MKTILGLLVAAQIFSIPATAINIEEVAISKGAIEYAIGGAEINRQEEFMWFYRVVNGKEQKRLWSVTYGYWVTDWIDCD